MRLAQPNDESSMVRFDIEVIIGARRRQNPER